MADLWVYRARFEKVLDGDTIRVLRDAGTSIKHTMDVRVADVDTCETSKGSDLSIEWAEAGKQFTQQWCDDAEALGDWPIVIHTEKITRQGNPRKSFTRYVAKIRRSDGAELDQDLIAKGYGLGVRGWAAKNRPAGVVWPGDWVREQGTRSKAHLVRLVTDDRLQVACGREIGAPGLTDGVDRCSRCWAWCGYSSELWAEICAADVLLTFGGAGTFPASSHHAAV